MLILGYTRTGIPVCRPVDHAPSVRELEIEGWTPGDHFDASHILREHSDREDEDGRLCCASWARAHRKTAYAHRHLLKRVGIRTATETSIRPRSLRG